MRTEVIRAVLALLVVGVFMMITSVMAIFPLFSSGNVEMSNYADFFAKTASVYTGIVGVIIGYYFGRSEKPARGSTEQKAPDKEEPGA